MKIWGQPYQNLKQRIELLWIDLMDLQLENLLFVE